MAGNPTIGYFSDDLGDDVVVCCDFGREKGRAEELFESICYAVEEFEDEEGFGVGECGGEEEQVVLEDGVEAYWWVEGGEVDEAGSWISML